MIKFSKFLFAIILLLSISSTSWAQDQVNDGTDDPDFDYLTDAEIEAEGLSSLEESLFAKTVSFISSRVRRASPPTSFSNAKVKLYKKLGDETTFYCGCNTDLVNRTFDKSSCGYVHQRDNVRAHRTEAEHVLPAFWIAKFKPNTTCWVSSPTTCGSSRKCCLANDAVFTKAHNDLVNLIPTIGELNSHRSKHPFDIIAGEKREYGQCDFEKVNGPSRVEPREEIRGDIARIYFYMRSEYSLEYPQDLIDQITQWDSDDPVSAEEIRRNKTIKRVQGSSNPFVK